MATLLAIDDEPTNLKLLRRYLAETDYTVLTAANGEEGWALLTTAAPPVEVILLDRMMPGMDGMAFMDTLRADPRFAAIPVIMQTAAAGSSQIAEGIRAGVFYYLTKPYDAEVLLAIVNAALQQYTTQRALQAEVKKNKHLLGLATESHFVFRTLEEVHDLSLFLANFFPDPERMVVGIFELLLNAVEHGNLGITYEEKTILNEKGNWEEEVQRRLHLPQYANKQVHVHYEKKADEIVLTISDEGSGFEWDRYMDIDLDRITHTHGRGIALARLLSFDAVRYEGPGNSVSCVVYCN
jgi:CheY-like chemotaxis protein/anti-sigma regulatory factor (Ser/Thr protein kinase)